MNEKDIRYGIKVDGYYFTGMVDGKITFNKSIDNVFLVLEESYCQFIINRFLEGESVKIVEIEVETITRPVRELE
jgi:hypothetical protein